MRDARRTQALLYCRMSTPRRVLTKTRPQRASSWVPKHETPRRRGSSCVNRPGFRDCSVYWVIASSAGVG
jgi:hypothetical protein